MDRNNKTKMERYADMQAMVQKEIKDMFPGLYAQEATKYGVAEVPLHTHNGYDSPRIKMQDIVASQGASGSITFSTDGQRYRIGLNTKPGSAFSPSVIRFNGIAIRRGGGGGSIDIRSLVVGDAFLGPSFYLQPESSTSVTIGGTPMTVIQSSSYILVNDSGSGPNTQASVSEGHIVSVIFNGVVVARATIPDLEVFSTEPGGPIQQGALIVDVELESNWEIIGNFVIM